MRLASVSPVGNRSSGDVRRDADHLRDGDRLADRAAHPEQDRRDQAAARVREDHAAHHLPARQPEAVARPPSGPAEPG